MRVELFLHLIVFAAACGRPSWSAFVPALDVRVRAQRHDAPAPSVSVAAVPWSAEVIASLRFQAQPAAKFVPARADFSGVAGLTPCDDDDLACLEEVAEGERQLSTLRGELE